jgi:hypothetical protein
MPIDSQDGKATTVRTTFRLAVTVTKLVEAPAVTIWNLLTDLNAQSRWNSTVTSIEGEVALWPSRLIQAA